MRYLEEDLQACGIKLEEWRKGAQQTGRCFRQVDEGVEVFMRKWHTGWNGGIERTAQDGCNRDCNR